MSVELRNRLSGRVGIKLPTTLAFDYPTPEAIAALLLREIIPELDATATTASTRPRVKDEPIAIVAMSCRTPGGVREFGGLLGAACGRARCDRSFSGALG